MHRSGKLLWRTSHRHRIHPGEEVARDWHCCSSYIRAIAGARMQKNNGVMYMFFGSLLPVLVSNINPVTCTISDMNGNRRRWPKSA